MEYIQTTYEYAPSPPTRRRLSELDFNSYMTMLLRAARWATTGVVVWPEKVRVVVVGAQPAHTPTALWWARKTGRP